MTPFPDAAAGRGEARSTAAVLWLMILLVFLPIASLHVAARAFAPGAEPPAVAAAAAAEAARR